MQQNDNDTARSIHSRLYCEKLKRTLRSSEQEACSLPRQQLHNDAAEKMPCVGRTLLTSDADSGNIATNAWNKWCIPQAKLQSDCYMIWITFSLSSDGESNWPFPTLLWCLRPNTQHCKTALQLNRSSGGCTTYIFVERLAAYRLDQSTSPPQQI